MNNTIHDARRQLDERARATVARLQQQFLQNPHQTDESRFNRHPANIRDPYVPPPGRGRKGSRRRKRRTSRRRTHKY